MEAIPAATLIAVRDADDGPPEVLMVERSRSMAFAPGAMVFPGGRVDPADRTLAMEHGHGDQAAAIAAIRETLEECAIGVAVDPHPGREQARQLQQALLAGEELGPLLADAGLRLNIDALTPFARWVPGHEVSRRFDTVFFLARATAGEEPHIGSDECTSARWISARAALAAEQDGTARLIYPTRKNLERLAQFGSFEEMLHDARAFPVTPITAQLERSDGELWVTIPDGLGYPLTHDRLPDVWRG